MNTLSNKPYLKRRRKLEDKEKRFLLEREPKDKKGPRRKLRVLDIEGKDLNELEFDND
jgi:hypothetical protein